MRHRGERQLAADRDRQAGTVSSRLTTAIALRRVLVAPAEGDCFDGSGRNVPGECFGDERNVRIGQRQPRDRRQLGMAGLRVTSEHCGRGSSLLSFGGERCAAASIA
jgi:hypothetical protein